MSRTSFVGGQGGAWRVLSVEPVRGEGLPSAPRLDIREEGQAIAEPAPQTPGWILRGVRSHVRYVERAEKALLDELSPPLGRSTATRAALIPIRKSAAWWELPQDERRNVFETRSRHIGSSLKYMPAVARRLYHCRDLGEPFDFLTWFEYAPADADRFEELVLMLRATEEWTFVDREVDVRLALEP